MILLDDKTFHAALAPIRSESIGDVWHMPVNVDGAWRNVEVVDVLNRLVAEYDKLRAEAKRADEEATKLANSDLATTEQVIRALRVELAHVRAEGAKALDQATRDMQEGARLLAEAEQRAKEWQNQCYVEVECGDGRVAAAEQRAAQAEAERDAAREEVARLLAENERLRAALHDVMGACDAECAGCGAYYVAKKALDATTSQVIRAAEAQANELDALGFQLAAARERLALALRVVEAARAPVLRGYLDLQDALAKFDTVPGDILHDTEAP